MLGNFFMLINRYRYSPSVIVIDVIRHGKVHVHDVHATILKLLGFDHTKLTYHYAGRDYRLTDLHGNIIDALIA